MTSLRVAAVQANYVLMDRAATLERVAALTAAAAAQGAQLVAFPEVFVPGTRSGSTPGRSGMVMRTGSGCSPRTPSWCPARPPSC